MNIPVETATWGRNGLSRYQNTSSTGIFFKKETQIRTLTFFKGKKYN